MKRGAHQGLRDDVHGVTAVRAFESGTDVCASADGDGDLGMYAQGGARLAVEVALDYVHQACIVLAEAHAAGIVHGDLKPHSLFLVRTADGACIVKVLEFGAPRTHTRDAPFPEMIVAVESASYIAPEQLVKGSDVDARADIWALGAILHAVIAGKPPFRAATFAATCLKVLTEPHSRLNGKRAEVVAVVDRCLAKDPAMRYQTVLELATALESCIHSLRE